MSSMLAPGLQYPLRDRSARDSLAVCIGLVLVALLLARVGLALWPAWLAAVPLLALVLPGSFFAGYLGRVLLPNERGTTEAIEWTGRDLRVGVTLLVVGAVYLSPAAVALFGTAFVLLGGRGAGSLLTIAPTIALVLTVMCAYVLPAALATGVHDGLRAALSRAAFQGLASGSYFFAWTVGTTLVVVGWSVLGAVQEATPAAILGAVCFAYTHVVAARLYGEGLTRSRWEA